MPPIRTPTLKPVKTERTHEENQERAYIAASRRSDRSLEARVESARRASEIHKKRTGRALRVTEQDVVNEEMYEEEDDDLPAQYRRLQSHLQTGSFEFNRRLQAYMTSQMGMRNALMEQTNFAGPYSNAPFFTNQFGQAQQQQQQQHPQPTMMNPQMLHFPSVPGHRQSPYPMSPPGFPGMHHRSASISTPQDFANYMSAYSTTQATPSFDAEEQQRRMSLPPNAMQQNQSQPMSRPAVSRTMSGASAASGSNGSGLTPLDGNSSNTMAGNFAGAAGPMLNQGISFSPFSPSLPAETQQLLGQPSGLADQSSCNPYWYSGAGNPTSLPYKPATSDSDSPSSKSQSTADPTLALNALDTSINGAEESSDNYVTSAHADGMSFFNRFGGEKNFGVNHLFGDDFKDSGTMTRSSSGQASGSMTPGTADWTNFLESFDDNTTP